MVNKLKNLEGLTMLKIVIRDLEETKRLAKIVSEGIEDRLVLLLMVI